MTKAVPLGSVENGLREALRCLGADRASDAIEANTGHRKSASLLRKCADPDDHRHHIQLRDAAALDRACVEAGHRPPIMYAYQQQLEAMPEVDLRDADFCQMTLAIGAATGAVYEAVAQSDDCNDCLCDTRANQRSIYEALEELEAATTRLRRAVLAKARENSPQGLTK